MYLGTCFGNMMFDGCGKCLSPSSSEWNNCIGCNGLPDESTYDCEGTCGGDYSSNPCGYCIESTRNDFNTYGIACDGTCSTTIANDLCGQCLDVSSSDWNNCVGCDNVANSGKQYNECGVCLVSNDTNFETAGKDCSGICYGTHQIDQCGNCLVDQWDEDWNNCTGCDGIPYSGKKYNPCGYCINSTRADFEYFGMYNRFII